MTDPTFDELASAHLDGATTPAEAARVAADPALRSRVEELRRIRDAVAEIPSVDPSRRDPAIAAAMAAFADDGSAEGRAPESPLATVTSRRGPSPTIVRVLGAAAAVALLALLVPILGRLVGSNDEDTASFDSSGAAIENTPDRAESGADDRAATTTGATRDGADLGTFEDLASLVAAVSSADPLAGYGTDSSLADGPGRAPSCPVPATGDTASEARVESARATVGGDAVVVVVHTERPGVRTLLVYRADDCVLLTERPL